MNMTPDELRRAQDRAIEATGDRTLEPTDGGLSHRVAIEHDAALRARADAAAHEATSSALTDVALSGPGHSRRFRWTGCNDVARCVDAERRADPVRRATGPSKSLR